MLTVNGAGPHTLRVRAFVRVRAVCLGSVRPVVLLSSFCLFSCAPLPRSCFKHLECVCVRARFRSRIEVFIQLCEEDDDDDDDEGASCC